MAGCEREQKTLYVGNLCEDVTEDLLLSIFGKVSSCTSCKIKREETTEYVELENRKRKIVTKDGGQGDPYAFIDFATHEDAAIALASLNKICLNNKEMKVNWATSPGNQQKQDTSKHYHIFVGDLGQDIEHHHLWDAFTPYGAVSDVKIIKDPQSNKSKGYGFVSFVKREEAETAIEKMNGQWLGSRSIRTNWATRKPPAPNQKEAVTPKSYEEVYNQSSLTNSTVYCGGFDKTGLSGDNVASHFSLVLTEEMLQKHFAEFGTIHEIRIFKEKGYAFIRFADHAMATRAICGMHGKEIEGNTLKCSWGRESGDPNNAANQQQQQVGGVGQQQFSNQVQNYQYYGTNMYWPAFSQAAAAAATQYGQIQQPATGYVQTGVTTAGQWPAAYNYQMAAAYNPAAAVNVAAMANYGMQVPNAGQQAAQYNGQQAAMMGYQVQQGGEGQSQQSGYQ
ncbi:nucleolysin TIAR-like isoform X4 [Lineus longissimus]|uniref:nucleolysin TIAR-like isoform X4 n=1 Tax=Lineus longissimus TaxID=88925 RepID=UPI00315D9A95